MPVMHIILYIQGWITEIWLWNPAAFAAVSTSVWKILKEVHAQES